MTRGTRFVGLTIVAALVLVSFASAPSVAQQHGGAITNTHNDLFVVEGDADNPYGLATGDDSVVTREVVSFANDDPNKTTNYGVIYITPNSRFEDGPPRVINYTWDFNVANYTMQLSNVTAGFTGNITGVTEVVHTIDPQDLGPDDPEASHPKANATYQLKVLVVDTRGETIMTYDGGEVTTRVDEPTVIDMSGLDLPTVGQNRYVADDNDLAGMTDQLVLEELPDFAEGWYRIRISGMAFEYGVRLTIEARYTVTMEDRRVVIRERLEPP